MATASPPSPPHPAALQESVKTRHPQLLYESKLYKILQGGGAGRTACWPMQAHNGRAQPLRTLQRRQPIGILNTCNEPTLRFLLLRLPRSGHSQRQVVRR